MIGAPGGSIDCFIFDRHFNASLLPDNMDAKPGFAFQCLNVQDKEKAEAFNSIQEASPNDVPLDDDFGFLTSR